MIRTIILEADGHQAAHSLSHHWGTKYAADWAVTLGQFSLPVRVLIQHNDTEASGILKIKGREIGLPKRRLIRTRDGLKASWPPVDLPGRGLTTVTLLVNGNLPPERPKRLRAPRGIKVQRARLHNIKRKPNVML